ncbi:MAG TPA: 7,8-didemethyl-8-hydroxy-5-deazariboflavin synthase subunit CofG, partial [Candidatus Obscuribacterales bacterium]
KDPQRRLQQLEWAGELHIPFTTGLLLGIGESPTDWQDTLRAIAEVHQRYGHIQEVILQPHRPGTSQTWGGEAFDANRLPDVVAIARQLLPPDITLQIPPNLVSVPTLLACLEAGARDVGGIGPTDEVNPDYPHPCDCTLAHHLEQAGWDLRPRLPIYLHHDDWLAPDLHNRVRAWRQRLGS